MKLNGPPFMRQTAIYQHPFRTVLFLIASIAAVIGLIRRLSRPSRVRLVNPLASVPTNGHGPTEKAD